jgi:hypothetical protein
MLRNNSRTSNELQRNSAKTTMVLTPFAENNRPLLHNLIRAMNGKKNHRVRNSERMVPPSPLYIFVCKQNFAGNYNRL